MVTVDSTVVNVALPAIEEDLGGGLAGQQWTANAYLVTLCSLLLIGGSLGDIFGERRVFALGVAAFGATSLVCALAPTIEVLVGARALQGVAGALLTPAALAVIVSTFPPDERGKAVGAWTAWGGIGTVLGPVIGGQLVDAASWRWIFAINVPIVLVTIMLILRVVPEGRERDPNARVDVVGALLCALGLAGLTFGLIEQPLHGWAIPVVALPLVLGALLFAGFLVWEAQQRAPDAAAGAVSRRNFAVGNLETFPMYGGLGLLFFFLVLFLQQVAGFSALEAGSSSIPVTLLMFGLSMRFGALADKHGPRFFMGVGPLVAAVGMALLMLRVDADVEYLTDVLPGLLVFGRGAVDDGRAADLDGAGRRGRQQRRDRLGGEQRDRARGGRWWRSRRWARWWRRRSGRSSTTRSAQQALARPEVARGGGAGEEAAARGGGGPGRARGRAGIGARGGARTRRWARSTMGLGIATVLVALGGILGLVGITNPRRRVAAAELPGRASWWASRARPRGSRPATGTSRCGRSPWRSAPARPAAQIERA